jgi:hypothetical protein
MDIATAVATGLLAVLFLSSAGGALGLQPATA